MKQIFTSLRIYVVFTVLLGLVYPVVVTLAARIVNPGGAAGALVTNGERVVGSALIAQNFTTPGYLHPRPSAIDYNPLASGGSNLGPLSKDLAAQVDARAAKLGEEATPTMTHASGSGLDPDLDLASAFAQVPRVAHARGMSEDDVRSIISKQTQPRQFGLFGEPRVNVLMVNLALDGR